MRDDWLLYVIWGILITVPVMVYCIFRFIAPWFAGLFERAVFGSGEATLRPQYSRAEALYHQGDWTNALAEYREVIKQYPEDVYAHLRIGEMLLQHFYDPEGAIQEFHSALEHSVKQEQRAFIRNRLADLYVEQLRDFEKARHHILQILEEMPNTRYAQLAQKRLVALNVRQQISPHTEPNALPSKIGIHKNRALHDRGPGVP